MLQTINEVFNVLYENDFIKTDYIIAFGEGVIGNISELVSSTYMEGINLINISTTLISRIDSSVGGKNGVKFR